MAGGYVKCQVGCYAKQFLCKTRLITMRSQPNYIDAKLVLIVVAVFIVL